MEEEHGATVQQQELHDAYQSYHAHTAYLDHAQAQAIAAYMPDFASLDPSSQAAAMQHYAHAVNSEAIVANEHQEQVQQRMQPSETAASTESDLEEGVDAGAKLCSKGLLKFRSHL